MATVGNLKVDLGLNSAEFDRGLNKTKDGMDGLAKRAAVMGAAIAAAVSAAAAAFTAIVVKTSEAANATGDMADMLGLNVEALQELRHAADRGGMSMNNFDVAMRRFIRRSAEAANGTGAAKGAFQELGIQLRTTDGRLKDSEALLAEVADAMEGVQDPADKIRLAFQMFDTDGAKMVNVLAGGSAELERLREEARKLGIVLDEDAIRAAQRFHDNLDTLRKGGEALANRLTTMALPAFVAVTSAMINVSAHMGDVVGGFLEFARYAGVAVSALAGFFAPTVIAGLSAVSVAIGTTMVGAVRALTAAMLANPLGLLIAGISAAVSAAFIFRDEIKQIIGVDFVAVMRDGANATIGAFVGAFDAVVATWGQLPAAMGDIVIRVANIIVIGIEEAVNKGIDLINGLIETARGVGIQIDTLGRVQFGGFSNPWEGAAAGVGGAASSAFADAQRNYIGEWTSALGEAWSTADGATSAINDLGGALDGGGSGGGVAGSARNAATAADEAGTAFQGMGDIGQQVTSKLADSFTDMFMAVIEGGKNLGDMIGSLLKDIGRMFLHQGFQALLGMGGGGLFGGIFSGIGNLFGFSRGGTILPGGAGGIDSQLVMFRKSPNERVDITKPGQTLTAGGGRMGLDVSVSVDEQGNLVPMIRKISGEGDVQVARTIERNFGGMMADYNQRSG